MEPKFGLIAAIVIAIAALFGADILLARIERQETHAQAEHYYAAGSNALDAGSAGEAVDQLRKAHEMDRENTAFSLRLAEALTSDAKLDEAQSILIDILARAPNDGQANLLEARLLVREGKDAGAYYHRAIYGSWPSDAEKHRIETRLELASLLAAKGDHKDLLAELLPLETEAQNDLSVRRQVAQLYFVAGSPARAEAAFTALVRQDPANRSDYTGLAEAQLALGNYHGAQLSFERAGDDREAAVASEMASLDPTLRRLSSEEFRRSMRILQLARDYLARCLPSDPSLAPADRVLRAKIRGAFTNELAEERISQAEQLWRQRPADCAPSSPSEEAITRLMPRLAQ